MRSYLNDGIDDARNAFAIGDSVLLVGTRSFNSTVQPMLMWLDYNGILLDTAVVDSPSYESITHAFLTPQNTLIVTGVSDQAGDQSFVGELTLNGQFQWHTEVQHPESYTRLLWQGCRTTGGTYVFTGKIQVPLNPGSEFRYWVVWVDSVGTVFRQQVIDWNGSLEDNSGHAITATADGGVVITGETVCCRARLIKLDADGNEVWRNSYRVGTAEEHWVYSIIETANGDFAITGTLDAFEDVFVARFDALGNGLWARRMNAPLWQEAYQIIESFEHRFLVTGITRREGRSPDVLLASLEPTGEIREFDLYDTQFDTDAFGICQLADSTFMAVGTGYVYEGGPWFHPGFYATRLSQDRRQPEPPSGFNLQLPEDSAVVGGPSVDFSWTPSFDPDPFDTVHYTLHLWCVSGTYDRDSLLEPQVTLPISVLQGLGECETIRWDVDASSGYPATTIPCESSFRFTLALRAEDVLVPGSFAVSVFPNPFNAVAEISFSLPITQTVRLAVYDIAGREVKLLTGKTYSAGEHRVTFHGTELPSGIYFVRVAAGEIEQTRKMLLMK